MKVGNFTELEKGQLFKMVLKLKRYRRQAHKPRFHEKNVMRGHNT